MAGTEAWASLESAQGPARCLNSCSCWLTLWETGQHCAWVSHHVNSRDTGCDLAFQGCFIYSEIRGAMNNFALTAAARLLCSTPTEGHKPSTPLLALALPAPDNDFSTQDIYRAHLIPRHPPRQGQKFLFLKAHSREKGTSAPGILHSLEGRAGTGVTVASRVVGPSVPSTGLCRVPLTRTPKAATTFPRVGT